MASILRKQVPRKQVHRRAAGVAVQYFHPEKGLNGHVLVTVDRAVGPVVEVDLVAKRGNDAIGSLLVVRDFEVLDLFADNPGGHRIDVEAIYVAADAVCFDERRAAAHERVRNP